MFLGAPLWSVLLINLGFVGTAVEVFVGRVSRLWLVLPVAWFSVYTGFAVADYRTLQQLRHDVAASNGAIHIPFDPKQQAMVMLKGSNDADEFAANYAIPVIYSPNSHIAGARHLATRVIDQETCAEVRRNDTASSLVKVGIFVHGLLNAPRLCVLSLPEDPVLPEVTVDVVSQETTVKGIPTTQSSTTVTTPDGALHVLRGGYAAPLPWFPRPVIGCTLNSGSPSWDCAAGFGRNSFMPLHDTAERFQGDSIALAQALGLSYVAPEKRSGTDQAQILRLIKVAKQRSSHLLRQ